MTVDGKDVTTDDVDSSNGSSAVETAQGRIRGGFVQGLLSKIFAIEKREVRKFFALSTMMFAIIYIFTMTRYAATACPSLAPLATNGRARDKSEIACTYCASEWNMRPTLGGRTTALESGYTPQRLGEASPRALTYRVF